jgi:hypothetical protein
MRRVVWKIVKSLADYCRLDDLTSHDLSGRAVMCAR